MHLEDLDVLSDGAQLGSAAWAAAAAERLLAATSWLLANTRHVAEHARWASAGIRPEDRDLLVAAAYLHEVGNSAAIAETGSPSLDGANYLHRHGLFELACLVAHHTSARAAAAPLTAVTRLARYPRPRGPVADALTYSVLTSGPAAGHDTFEEIGRWQQGTTVDGQTRTEIASATNAAVARTLRRVTRTRPPSAALTITPVVLGCLTLVRLQGTLDESTAEDATRVLRIVLDQRPHAVAVDLALLTGIDIDGASGLRSACGLAADPGVLTLIDPRGRDRSMLERVYPSRTPPPIVYGIESAVAAHCS